MLSLEVLGYVGEMKQNACFHTLVDKPELI